MDLSQTRILRYGKLPMFTRQL